MKLVDADVNLASDDDESPRPIPGARPDRRRVSVSLLLTLAVLVGTVALVFTLFDERHDLLMTKARQYHTAPPTWSLTAPTAGEARAWMVGVLGSSAPWPPQVTEVVGATEAEILRRPTAILRVREGAEESTLLIQKAPGIAPRPARTEDGVGLTAQRTGPWIVVRAHTAR